MPAWSSAKSTATKKPARVSNSPSVRSTLERIPAHNQNQSASVLRRPMRIGFFCGRSPMSRPYGRGLSSRASEPLIERHSEEYHRSQDQSLDPGAIDSPDDDTGRLEYYLSEE